MMRLWLIGSTRGEEANEIEIGNLHESGSRVLVSTLLAVIVRLQPGRKVVLPPVQPEARKAIEAGYVEWAKAPLAMDKNKIERMLAPDL